MAKKQDRTAKIASRTSDDLIIEFLAGLGGDIHDLFLYGDANVERRRIARWDTSYGLRVLMIEDTARAYAAKRYLARIGARHYKNRDELLKKGFEERWPQLISGIAQGNWHDDLYIAKMYPSCADDTNLRYLVHDLQHAPRLRLELLNGRITDEGLRLLRPLTQLVELDVTDNSVSIAGITELSIALPSCKITF